MEKKYYYTNPLKAALASRYFDVIMGWYNPFSTEFYLQQEPYEMPFIHHMVDADKMNLRPSQYYIHSDSLSVFTPQSGDLCEYAHPTEELRYSVMMCDEEGRQKKEEYGEYIKILQRKGRMFPWYDGVEEEGAGDVAF